MSPRRPPDALAPFHPLVRRWFTETLGAPSAPQREGWPAIARGEHTLILAPTGTGKTLSAFLWELNALIVDGLKQPLANAVHLLYISPLKALNNDIQRNLEEPLQALKERFEAEGKVFPEIRVAVRTGDTPASARARMLRKSPHILITTPESLHILLTTLRARGMFSALRAVVVDEIHAVAGTKRGAHLALTLERLERACERPPQRIGLSATQRPLEEIARFLGGMVGGNREAREPGGNGESGMGNGERDPDSQFPVPDSLPTPGIPVPASRPAPRPVTIVDCGLVKQMEIMTQSPVADLGDVGGTVWPKVADLALHHIRQARTTLIFVNNRAQAERMAARINATAEEELALPYHGSLSRERRFLLESRLKAGELRALVTTSSLELGIDIGTVDLVIQLQSPKRVAAGLQRVGRAGHTLNVTSRGILVPTFRDDAMEIVAIAEAMREGDVEPTRVVQNALDVLAQVIVAAVSVDDWTAASLFGLVRRAYPFHALTRGAFDEVLAMLSGKYPADLAAELEPRISWDRATDLLTGSRAARMTAVISGGTIPDRGLYTVNLPDRTRLGELDEEFVHESRVGDVFQLGSTTWRIASIEHDRVIVNPAPGAPARMPFWHGEYMARSVHLTPRIGEIRRMLVTAAGNQPATDGDRAGPVATEARRHGGFTEGSRSGRDRRGGVANEERDRNAAGDPRVLEREAELEEAARVRAVTDRLGCDAGTAESLLSYIREQRAYTGVIPDDRTLVVEEFRDETAAVRVVLHAPFGGRVNAPWGLALAQRAREALAALGVGTGRTVDVQVQTTDDGIMLRLPNLGADTPVRALLDLAPDEAERRVIDEVGQSSLFGARFRMNAARALLLPRGNPRRRMPLWLQRLKAADLLETVREWPSFPILVETYRDVLQDAFDMPALRAVLGDIAEGRIRVHVVEGDRPSPFAASLQFGFVMDWMYGDDTPRAEQRAAMLSLDRALLDELMGTQGADDDTLRALEEVVAQRQGTAPGRRPRTADELATVMDRWGDVARGALSVAREDEGLRGDPLQELLERGRAIEIGVPTSQGVERRLILTENYGRYAAAFGEDALARVWTGARLDERDAADVVPEVVRRPTLTKTAARREILARWLAVSGPVSVEEILARYRLPEAGVRQQLEEWERRGRLVRGLYGPGGQRWASRRLLEQARRRALAAARKAIEAVELPAFQDFLQRWQHLHPAERLDGQAGVADALAQLYGVARPAEHWERDYLPARVRGYDPRDLSALAARGDIVWVGGGTYDEQSGTRNLTTLRFIERGTGAVWLPPPDESPLSANAAQVRDALAAQGASFIGDLQAATGLGQFALRDALRELVAAGLATNDSLDAMREVIRWRKLPPGGGRGRPDDDPTRWLPADYTPSPGRRVVQRRPNLRRLPKWRRPDRPGGEVGWVGRWSLVRVPGIMGPGFAPASGGSSVGSSGGVTGAEDPRADAVARQWLERYGVVTRDWWRRERPAVPWRSIYRELRRLELRGEVRRGYFVRGLAGAQFALPEAVERLRAATPVSAGGEESSGDGAALGNAADAAVVVMATSDPANVYALPLEGTAERDPLARPRGRGALLATVRGRLVLAIEGRGERISVASGVADTQVTEAARELARHVASAPRLRARARDLVVERIDGEAAGGSRWLEAFQRAGFRGTGSALRIFAGVV